MGISIAVLVIGGSATGLAGYTFFIILPPALSSMNNAGWDLINYNPGTQQEFYNGASKLSSAGSDLQNLGRSIPCSSAGGCLGVIDFSSQRNQLVSMGSNLKSLSDNIRNAGDDFSYTVNVIHSVGYGALGIKDGLYYGVMTMVGMGIAILFAGAGLTVAAAAFRDIAKEKLHPVS